MTTQTSYLGEYSLGWHRIVKNHVFESPKDESEKSIKEFATKCILSQEKVLGGSLEGVVIKKQNGEVLLYWGHLQSGLPCITHVGLVDVPVMHNNKEKVPRQKELIVKIAENHFCSIQEWANEYIPNSTSIRKGQIHLIDSPATFQELMNEEIADPDRRLRNYLSHPKLEDLIPLNNSYFQALLEHTFLWESRVSLRDGQYNSLINKLQTIPQQPKWESSIQRYLESFAICGLKLSVSQKNTWHVISYYPTNPTNKQIVPRPLIARAPQNYNKTKNQPNECTGSHKNSYYFNDLIDGPIERIHSELWLSNNNKIFSLYNILIGNLDEEENLETLLAQKKELEQYPADRFRNAYNRKILHAAQEVFQNIIPIVLFRIIADYYGTLGHLPIITKDR